MSRRKEKKEKHQVTRPVSRAKKGTIVSSDYAEAKPFVPSYLLNKEKDDMWSIMSNEYEKRWIVERDENEPSMLAFRKNSMIDQKKRGPKSKNLSRFQEVKAKIDSFRKSQKCTESSGAKENEATVPDNTKVINPPKQEPLFIPSKFIASLRK